MTIVLYRSNKQPYNMSVVNIRITCLFFSQTEDKKTNSSVRFHSFNRKEPIPEDELVLRERSFDYKHRYCGHCNTTTDIKEANFFGRSALTMSLLKPH